MFSMLINLLLLLLLLLLCGPFRKDFLIGVRDILMFSMIINLLLLLLLLLLRKALPRRRRGGRKGRRRSRRMMNQPHFKSYQHSNTSKLSKIKIAYVA
jgi:hypothetical protein